MKRDYKIDSLRCIGTLLVILAHMNNIPSTLQEIRAFDVVLLVFISGVSFAYTYNGDYRKYIKKRVKRLVFPTYIMMILVFTISGLVCWILGREQLYSISKMLRSFAFLDNSMGYIWIVKVYMIIALMSPLLIMINTRLKTENTFILMIFGSMVIQKLLLNLIKNVYILGISDYLLYIIPYSCVYLVGIRLKENNWKFCKRFGLINFISFIILTAEIGEFVPSKYKYPPDIYFIVYGMIVTILLLKIIPNKKIKFIEYISKNSFMLYLAHVPCILAYNLISSKLMYQILNYWWIEYIIVIFLSMIIVFILKFVGREFKSREHFKKKIKKY